MGMYSSQAASFSSGVKSLASSLNAISTGLSSINKDLSMIEGDVISSNVVSRNGDIEAKKKAIIGNLEGIASKGSAKAIELDKELEEEEKRKKEAELKKNGNKKSS